MVLPTSADIRRVRLRATDCCHRHGACGDHGARAKAYTCTPSLGFNNARPDAESAVVSIDFGPNQWGGSLPLESRGSPPSFPAPSYSIRLRLPQETGKLPPENYDRPLYFPPPTVAIVSVIFRSVAAAREGAALDQEIGQTYQHK